MICSRDRYRLLPVASSPEAKLSRKAVTEFQDSQTPCTVHLQAFAVWYPTSLSNYIYRGQRILCDFILSRRIADFNHENPLSALRYQYHYTQTI